MLQAMRTLRLLAIFAGCCILAAVGCQDAGTALPTATPAPTGSWCPVEQIQRPITDPAQDVADSAVWQHLSAAGKSRNRAALRLLHDDALWNTCITLPTESFRASLAEAGDAERQMKMLAQEGAEVHEAMQACLADTPPSTELPALDESELCRRYNDRLLPAVIGSQIPMGYLELLVKTGRPRAGETYQLLYAEWPICYGRLSQGLFSQGTVGQRVHWDAMATVDCRTEAYGQMKQAGWQPQGPFPGATH